MNVPQRGMSKLTEMLGEIILSKDIMFSFLPIFFSSWTQEKKKAEGDTKEIKENKSARITLFPKIMAFKCHYHVGRNKWK